MERKKFRDKVETNKTESLSFCAVSAFSKSQITEFVKRGSGALSRDVSCCLLTFQAGTNSSFTETLSDGFNQQNFFFAFSRNYFFAKVEKFISPWPLLAKNGIKTKTKNTFY